MPPKASKRKRAAPDKYEGDPFQRAKKGSKATQSQPQSSQLQSQLVADESEESSGVEELFERLQQREYILSGVKYVRADDVAGLKKGKNSTSMIWKFDARTGRPRGFKVIDPRSQMHYYYCCQCIDVEKRPDAQLFECRNGTSPILNHWRNAHKVDADGNPVSSLPQGQQALSFRQRSTPSGSSSQLVWKINLEKFKMLLLRWIVYCHIAIHMVENLYFQALIQYLHENIAALLPGRKTVRRWIMAEFARRKRLLRRELKGARSNIHITFDMWSSPNAHAVLAINAHFVDSKGCLQNRLLAIKEVFGEHSGDNMAAVVLQVIKEYKIGKRVGFFMLDNAAANDVCVDLICRKLFPWMTKKQRERRRLRCLGHVINLAAQVLILGKDAVEDLQNLEYYQLSGDFTSITTAWRKKGVLGKIHNIVKYIRMTPQRRQEFAKCVVDERSKFSQFNHLDLIQSNSTRWNSYFMSINRFINCRPRIEAFCNTHKPTDRSKGIEEDRLTPTDWEILGEIQTILQPYYEATLFNEGHGNDEVDKTFSQYFKSLHWLQRKIKGHSERLAIKAKESGNTHYELLSAFCNHSLAKIDDYCDKMEGSAAYVASMVLDPAQKKKWFTRHWLEPSQRSWEWEKGMAPVYELWNEEYKGKFSTPVQRKTPRRRRYIPTNDDDTQWGSLQEDFVTSSDFSENEDYYRDQIDRFTRYQESNREPEHALQYWNQHHLVDPDLTRFAYDMLSIPLMSDECERTFSSAKNLITDARNRLKMDIIEANEFLKASFGRPTTIKDAARSLGDPAIDNLNESEAGERIASAGVHIIMEDINASIAHEASLPPKDQVSLNYSSADDIPYNMSDSEVLNDILGPIEVEESD